jgi:Lon protease-like protein
MRPASIAELPQVLAVFPLPGVLLLPFGRLPLNIFEPRYLAMTRDALAGDRLIGMVQPADPDSTDRNPPLYRVGCAGRITSFTETDDNRFLITLTGLCRFEIADELPLKDGYRRVHVDWSRFAGDMRTIDAAKVPRARLMPALREYFRVHGIRADWKSIEAAPGDMLLTSLAMVCPFDAPEKQALLETDGIAERAELMISLLTMSVLDHGGPEPSVN